MSNIINIPNVTRDERIGSAFNYLFLVIHQVEAINGNDIIWDFKDCSFFHPFFLFPLALYRSNCEKKIICRNIPPYLTTYFNLIYFNDLLCIDKNVDIEEILDGYIQKTYIPICKFDLCSSNVDGLQTTIQNIIETQIGADKRITTPLSYFFGELICNISQHSKSKFGYIYSQYIHQERCIDICIADSGITVLGSYINTGKYLDVIGDDDALALKMANEGYSTKDLPETENRGYGISSSKNMLVDGLGGAFFMLSGGGFHRHSDHQSYFIKLPDSISWNGTIILMRIPIDVPTDFKYEKYIQ